MIRFLRDLRLLPIAVLASACLLALKAADFVLDRGILITAERAPAGDTDKVVYTAPGVPQPSDPPRSWAQQMFNFPDSNGEGPPAEAPSLAAIAPLARDKAYTDITGSIGGNADDKGEAQAKSEAADAAGKDGKAASAGKDSHVAPPSGTVIPSDGPPAPSAAERAILERLSERRQELDKRARELDIREGLIAEAEKRIEARLAEVKQDQAELATATEKKDEAEAARFKGLVTMYENMKPRDAAKIFDRLEIGVLIEVASQINPRRMADILAQMAPATAERLTVEFANRAKAVAKDVTGDLPKIEGRPTSQ
jgi:flagellar motility protein MotE (MotC chaperone)